MKKSIELLKKILKSKVQGKVKGIYIGDPWQIPDSQMPCLILNPNRTETNIIDNQRDSHNHFIDISLVIDARQFLDATPLTMVGTNFLMETMENEKSDGTIDPNSLLGVLRDNLDMETNRFIQNVSGIDYTVRRRTEQLITLEAVMHIQIQYFINR